MQTWAVNSTDSPTQVIKFTTYDKITYYWYSIDFSHESSIREQVSEVHKTNQIQSCEQNDPSDNQTYLEVLNQCYGQEHNSNSQ